jgi:hypothetical protein
MHRNAFRPQRPAAPAPRRTPTGDPARTPRRERERPAGAPEPVPQADGHP